MGRFWLIVLTGGGSARPVCPESVNRDTAVFQSVEKKKMKQAIICTILSASNTSLWRFLWKGFYRRRGRADKDLEKFGKTGTTWPGDDGETLLYGGHRFFCSPEDCGTLQGCCSSADSMFACAHGDCECLRADACAGAAAASAAELRVRGVDEAVGGEGVGVCGLTESECEGSVCDI